MLSRRYQKSICTKGNYLHKFREVERNEYGILERCERCGLRKHFPQDIPSSKYLEFHIREVLQTNDAIYYHEYER
jgi:predicted nucleic-acid-binding Zn-ribbon protein